MTFLFLNNIFSWVDKSKIEKRNIIKSSSRNNTHSRLLKKIDKSLQKINKKKKIISSNNIVNKFRQFTNKEENEENNAYKTIKTDTNNKKIFNNIRRSRNLKNNNRIDNHVLKALNEKIKKITFQEKTYLIKKKTKNIYNENIINPTVFNINKSQKIFNNKKNKYLSKGNLNNSHTIDKIQNDFNDLIFDINYKKRTFVNNNQKKQILKMSILKNYSVKSKTKVNTIPKSHNSSFFNSFNGKEKENINYRRIEERFNNNKSSLDLKKFNFNSINRLKKIEDNKNIDQSHNYLNSAENTFINNNAFCTRKKIKKKEILIDVTKLYRKINSNKIKIKKGNENFSFNISNALGKYEKNITNKSYRNINNKNDCYNSKTFSYLIKFEDNC